MAAALAYDEEARRSQGARAIVNFPRDCPRGQSSVDIKPARPLKPVKLIKPAAPGRRHKSSQYWGVSIRESGRWTARIKHNGKDIVIGRFDTEVTISRLALVLVRNLTLTLT